MAPKKTAAPKRQPPKLEPREALALERLQLLIADLGDELNRGRGWQSEVARRLGVSRSHLSKILRGERGVGWAPMARVAERLGLEMDYFTSKTGRWRDYLASSDGSAKDRPDRYSEKLFPIERIVERAEDLWMRAAHDDEIDLTEVDAIVNDFMTLRAFEEGQRWQRLRKDAGGQKAQDPARTVLKAIVRTLPGDVLIARRDMLRRHEEAWRRPQET